MEGGEFHMSSSIDERVVSMKFDNAEFQRNVQSTLDALTALNKGLKLDGASKGLGDLNAAAKNVNLDHIANSADRVKNHIHAMHIAAVVAIATIAHQATL